LTRPPENPDLETTISEWIAATWHESMLLGDWWEALAAAGYAFPTWPVGLGGMAATTGAARVVTGALAAAGVIGPPDGNGPNMGAPTVLAHGTEAQQARFVRPVAAGLQAWCQLFSEPGAGSDLAGLGTRAVRDGDEFIVTGQKVWSSFAQGSDRGMLLARTNPDVPKHRGLSWMMIEMDQPGIEVRPLVQMNGAADFCEVFLDEARVRVADVVGGVDGGWSVAKTTLAHERRAVTGGRNRRLLTVPAGRLGQNLDRPVGEILSETRVRRGRRRRWGEVLLGSHTIIELARAKGLDRDPTVRQELTRYHVHSEVYRLTNQRVRDNTKRGRVGPEASIGKLSLAMLAHRSRDLSLALLGAEGMLVGPGTYQDGRVQQAALSSHVPSIGGGTNEIQRNIIGERALGLPREPSVDDDVPFRELRR
jgi:alkylation response protein AidB-like acyl-CoA dehydrogenase